MVHSTLSHQTNKCEQITKHAKHDAYKITPAVFNTCLNVIHISASILWLQ